MLFSSSDLFMTSDPPILPSVYLIVPIGRYYSASFRSVGKSSSEESITFGSFLDILNISYNILN